MDARLTAVPVVASFAQSVQPIVAAVAVYAGGSLATGDYQPGRSDLDLVAVVERPLDRTRQRSLTALHERLIAVEPAAAKLHCVYVPRSELADVAAAHLTWAHGELFRRPWSAIGRAELLAGGITVLGLPPAVLVPDVDRGGLAAAARGELDGYWRGALRKPWLWLRDVYVDLGLLTLVRAEATLRTGRLITKREAIDRLPSLGVGPELADEIARRRRGEPVRVDACGRVARARAARRVMRAGLRALT